MIINSVCKVLLNIIININWGLFYLWFVDLLRFVYFVGKGGFVLGFFCYICFIFDVSSIFFNLFFFVIEIKNMGFKWI